jgi:hypothetical protein
MLWGRGIVRRTGKSARWVVPPVLCSAMWNGYVRSDA